MNEEIIVRRAFTNPIAWRAGKELVRRGSYEVVCRERHWTWEWIALRPVKSTESLEKLIDMVEDIDWKQQYAPNRTARTLAHYMKFKVTDKEQKPSPLGKATRAPNRAVLDCSVHDNQPIEEISVINLDALSTDPKSNSDIHDLKDKLNEVIRKTNKK